MNITVYLGSSPGKDPKYREAAAELGAWIGAHGHRLVYGGSAIGLMGALADAVLKAGGEVIGVEPRFFIESALQHDGITELIAVDTMLERKAKMIELGDAFLAFPGGTGTLEEIAEIMSRVKLGLGDEPCLLYDLDGYYRSLRQLLADMEGEGFLAPGDREKFRFIRNLDELEEALAGAK